MNCNNWEETQKPPTQGDGCSVRERGLSTSGHRAVEGQVGSKGFVGREEEVPRDVLHADGDQQARGGPRCFFNATSRNCISCL